MKIHTNVPQLVEVRPRQSGVDGEIEAVHGSLLEEYGVFPALGVIEVTLSEVVLALPFNQACAVMYRR